MRAASLLARPIKCNRHSARTVGCRRYARGVGGMSLRWWPAPLISSRRRLAVEALVEPAQAEPETDQQDAAAEDREGVGSEIFEPLGIEVQRPEDRGGI